MAIVYTYSSLQYTQGVIYKTLFFILPLGTRVYTVYSILILYSSAWHKINTCMAYPYRTRVLLVIAWYVHVRALALACYIQYCNTVTRCTRVPLHVYVLEYVHSVHVYYQYNCIGIENIHQQPSVVRSGELIGTSILVLAFAILDEASRALGIVGCGVSWYLRSPRKKTPC